MSRVGKAPIELPAGVSVTIGDGVVKVKGPKGELASPVLEGVDVTLDGTTLTVTQVGTTNEAHALHGTMRALIANMIVGVTEGYVKNLDIIGVGYTAELTGRTLHMKVGLSHPIVYEAPQGIELEVPESTRVVVRGIDKQLVGQTAAEIRAFRPPEPYKGKGIRYHDEYVRRKAGKLAVSSGS